MIEKYIKLPQKKISDQAILNFFLSKNINLDDSKIRKIEVKKNIYRPVLMDLYRLYNIISLNKRTSILEFGSGWSSVVIAKALLENKTKIKNKKNPIYPKFDYHILENENFFLRHTKKKIKYFTAKNHNNKISYYYSKCNLINYCGKFATEYKNLPSCNPDFIYLDGPDQYKIKNKINNFSVASPRFMPMVSDLLLIEYYLTKGTILLIDGRGANAQFLRDNFKRKWIYKYFKEYDQHLFYLNAESFGPKNDLLLKFYQSRN